MGSAFKDIQFELHDGVGRIVLNRPPVNVLNIAMMEEIQAALRTAQAAADPRAIVFSATGRVFSAGVDVAAHLPEQVETMLRKFHAVIRAVMQSKKVTIATVRGTCLGGGAELAAVCDMAFTTDSANWGFPEISLGCFPPVACALLGAVVGQKHAAEMILTGRQISGEEAMRIGLANEALPEDELAEIVDDTCDRLGQLSPAALALTKKALHTWDAAHVDKGIERAERIYFQELIQTEDAVEGVRAFLEKRPAKWKGR